MKTFILGGIEVPVRAALQFRQTYGLKGAVDPNSPEKQADLTMGNCNTVRQACSADGGINAKLTTTVSATTGWVPGIFAGLNFNRPILVECIAPRIIGNASNVFDITYKRRSGSLYEPVGYAVVDGDVVETPLSMSGDEATLTVVSGATAYLAQYYPKFNLLGKPSEDYDSHLNIFTWTLQGEEI